MKKGLINESFRLQQLAGIAPLTVKEGFDSTKYVEQGIQNLLKIAKDALLQGAKEEGIKLDETVYSGDITSGGPGGNLQDYSDIEKSSYFDLVSQLLDDYESVLRDVVEEDGFNGNWEEYYSNNEPVFVEGSESIESWWDDEEILMPDMIIVTYDSGIENYVWKAERYEKAI